MAETKTYRISEWFEYVCPQGHRNQFKTAYAMSGGGILGNQPQAPQMPQMLPCENCNYELVSANLVSTSKGHYSETDFYKFADMIYTESSAYHEAAHVVVGALGHIPLRKDGIRIDQKGAGFSHYKTMKPTGLRNLGSDAKRGNAIRSTLAGYIAQSKYYLRFFNHLPTAGSSHDEDYVNALLEEMYDDRRQFDNAKTKLSGETQHIVDEHWQAIEALAQTLLRREWQTQAPRSGERRWSTQTLQKRIDGFAVLALVKQFDIPVSIELKGTLAMVVRGFGFMLGYLDEVWQHSGARPTRV